MDGKRKGKSAVDFAMIALLPCLMAYSLIGETVHEWLGITMFLLWMAHHIFNVKWCKSLKKGCYTATRTVGAVINGLLAITMFFMIISGIMMSKHVFAFLAIEGGASLARTLHLLGSYWGFILMSLHLGFHWNIIMTSIDKLISTRKESQLHSLCLRAAAVLLSFYGVLAFVRRQLAAYLLMQNQFVFFDFSEHIAVFLADYLAIMILFACIGYYGRKLLKRVPHAGPY